MLFFSTDSTHPLQQDTKSTQVKVVWFVRINGSQPGDHAPK